MTTRKKAKKCNWKTRQMNSFYEINWNYEFSNDEYENLKLGSIPKTMENKWFIYEENNIVYFHRSFTGICIYELKLDVNTHKHLVKINTDPNEYIAEEPDKELIKLTFIIKHITDQYEIFLEEIINQFK